MKDFGERETVENTPITVTILEVDADPSGAV